MFSWYLYTFKRCVWFCVCVCVNVCVNVYVMGEVKNIA